MQDGKHVILCVDDDADVRDYMEAVLPAAGYVCITAESAEAGLKAARENEPDLIVVDLMMEEVDAGTNFVKEVRASGKSTPIYMLSSVGDNLSLVTDYSALGLDGVFQKPLQKDRLLSVIETRLK